MKYWQIYYNQITDISEFKTHLDLGKDYLTDNFFGFIFQEGLVQICGGKLGNGKVHFPFKDTLFTLEYVLDRISEIELENSLPKNVIFISEEEMLDIVYSKEVSSGQSYLEKQLRRFKETFEKGAKKILIGKDRQEVNSFQELKNYFGIKE